MAFASIRKSIRNKYFVLLCVFGILPTLVLGIVSNNVSSNILERELNKSTYQTMEKASINVGSLLQRMSDLSDLLIQSLDNVSASQTVGLNDLADSSQKKKEINDILKNASKFMNFPTHIYLIDQNSTVYCNIQITSTEENEILKAITTNSDYEIPSEYENSVYWLGVKKNLLRSYDSNYVYYIARNIIYDDEYFGTIYIGTGDYIISRMFNNIEMNSNSKIFVFNQFNQLLADMPQENNRLYVDNKQELDVLIVNPERPEKVEILGAENSVTFLETRFGWKVLMLTPIDSIRSNLMALNRGAIAITIFSVLFIILSLLLVERQIVKPIIYLSGLMNAARKGNLAIRSKLDNHDEIGTLSDGFNEMLADFNNMIEKIHADEVLKKKLEFEVLEAQINPHFLYNTLNSIRWMAEMNHETKVGDSIVSLVRMMEYTSKRNKDKFVTLGQELQYMKEYIYLQSMRYWNRFEVVFDVDEKYQDYQMLKFTLQPIIENSILHGLNDNKEKLLITISCQETEENFIIVIRDNGIGINREVLNRINGHLPDQEKDRLTSGIGLYNVNNRIKLEFGEHYGLNISSVQGKGTDVRIVLPLANRESGVKNEDSYCG